MKMIELIKMIYVSFITIRIKDDPIYTTFNVCGHGHSKQRSRRRLIIAKHAIPGMHIGYTATTTQDMVEDLHLPARPISLLSSP